AEQQGVAPKIIANGEDLDRIAHDGEKADVDAMQGWRREVFGEKALQLLAGQLAIRFQNRRIVVTEVS
ncbi:MAG: ribonuclease D, partial [Mesorhizobium sp.]